MLEQGILVAGAGKFFRYQGIRDRDIEAHMASKKADEIKSLTERHLAPSLSEETGWSGDLAQLPDARRKALLAELTKAMTDAQADRVLQGLDRSFATAFEIARAQCRLLEASDGKEKSRKLGVWLRNEINRLQIKLAEGEVVPHEVCSAILSIPILERVVTPFLEERLQGWTVDPLRKAPEIAFEHLPYVLTRIHDAIHAGVTTGPVEPIQDFLASAVVNSMDRATGHIPGRTWIEERAEETGVGLEVCRILAAALNDALLAPCQSERPADMAKAFRRAITAAKSGG